MSISRDEFLRRYTGIRRAMREDAMDCLVIAGRNDYFSQGNIRYVTGLAFGGYALFPPDGKPVCFLSRNQIGSPKHQKAGPLQDLVEFRELTEPISDITGQMNRFDGGGNIGVVGMTDIPVPTYLGLKARLGERMVDSGAIFNHMRNIKSS